MTETGHGIIEQFAAGVVLGRTPESLCKAVVNLRPPGSVLATRMEALIPESTLTGRCAIITVAIELADDPRYRSVVERLLEEPTDVGETYPNTIYDSGATLRSDALDWWFDTIASRPRWRHQADRLIHQKLDTLLVRRRDAVIAHLAAPGRGPGVYGVWAAADVLCALGCVPAIESAWLEWVRGDQFTNRLDLGPPYTPGHGTRSDLTGALEQCMNAGVLGPDDELVRATSASR